MVPIFGIVKVCRTSARPRKFSETTGGSRPAMAAFTSSSIAMITV